MTKKDINNILSYITEDKGKNTLLLKKVFKNLNYRDDEGSSLLHMFVDEHYDEYKVLLVIKTLLNYGINPNLIDEYKYNFIQRALYAYPGYSEEFIVSIIKESLNYGLCVNHIDETKDTIMHTAIYSETYMDNIKNIYKLLIKNGFDKNKVDEDGRNLVDAMKLKQSETNKFTSYDVQEFESLFNDNKTNKLKKNEGNNDNDISEDKLFLDNLIELEKFGVILNKKDYINQPTIGRENEMKNLMITLAQDKSSPIIVGKSGVGKTSLVDELAFRIQRNDVPSFLKDKIILELDIDLLEAGTEYRGQFESKINKLIEFSKKYDVILFIDEIHLIYGIGATKGTNKDMAAILKKHIDRSNLKVIGTTTEEEYDEYLSNDALKRRFEKVIVKEPTVAVLYQIINKVMYDYCKNKNIVFQNDLIKKEIINTLLVITSDKHRIYNDKLNNPELSIHIIDKAFALAKVCDSDFITVNHFIETISTFERLSSPSRKYAVETLKKLNSYVKPKQKVYKIDFNNYKR